MTKPERSSSLEQEIFSAVEEFRHRCAGQLKSLAIASTLGTARLRIVPRVGHGFRERCPVRETMWHHRLTAPRPTLESNVQFERSGMQINTLPEGDAVIRPCSVKDLIIS